MRIIKILSSIILISTILFSANCVRFKVEKLGAKNNFKVEYGNEAKKYNVDFAYKIPSNIPNHIYSDSDYVYLSEPARGLVKVLYKTGGLHLLLGQVDSASEDENKNDKSKKSNKKKKIKKKKKTDYLEVAFPLSQPIKVVPDREGNFYVQNRIIPGKINNKKSQKENSKNTKSKKKVETPKSIPYSSYILLFSEKGELSKSLGIKGNNSAPFSYIFRMNVNDNGDLIVFHSLGMDKYISWFNKEGELLKEIDAGLLNVIESDEDKDYERYVEEIIPFSEDNSFLVSISYREKKSKIKFRMKYRKIFKFSLEQFSNNETKVSGTMLLEISDPNEALFWTAPLGGFYIWQNENSYKTIRIQVYDKLGTHINNKLIELPSPRSYWRNPYSNLSYEFYTVYADKKELRLYSWR